MRKGRIFLLITPLVSFYLTGCNTSVNNESIKTLEIYASNDFHGQVMASNNYMGLANFGTFMKERGEEENTLLLDQGDTWQGSIYSNYNYGALVNDVMCAAKFDAWTVGNHDFDWGLKPLIDNTARSFNGYTIPTLAANVYDYDFSSKTVGNIQQEDIGRKTVTYTLENGLKVGIVGTIGENQITTITSSYVQDIAFTNHIEVIKQEAVNLKCEGCDIVIATCHSGQEDLLNNGLQNYVDLVLCGHTHQDETTKEGNLYYAQFACYGEEIGHITLTYNVEKKMVTKTKIEALGASSVKRKVKTVDPTIENLISTYNAQCDKEANVVVANNTYRFYKNEQAPNLMCKAIYDQCVEEGFGDVVLTYCNTARMHLPEKEWTYADLYASYPFDNVVYIVSVKGSDIINEIKGYNNAYINPSFDCQIKYNSYYKIACIDYLLYHTNAERYFDYFRSFSGVVDGELSKNYRVLLKDWLISNHYNEGVKLNSYDYSSSVSCFDKNRLTKVG